MSNKQVSTATTQAPPSLPDLNAQTYPFDVVLHLLDQSAYFNLIASPDSENTNNRNSDFNINNSLHVFESNAEPPTVNSGMKVRQIFGQAVGAFRSRWLPIPNDFVAGPGREPPKTDWDRSRSQRFVMEEGTFSFGDEDGFRGFGTGRTFPTTVNGQNQLLAGAIGTTLEGFGRFWGLEGTYVFNGIITPDNQFRGNVAVRIFDPKGKFRPSGSLRPPQRGPDLDPGITYIVLRGNKKDASVKSEYDFAPDGSVRGLLTPAEMRAAQYRCAKEGNAGIRSKLTIGPVVGNLRAVIYFDLLAPPGTAYVPSPFTTNELYQFVDSDRKIVGTIKADVVEGESFGMRLPAAPGQPAIRFAGYGGILEGTGAFEGIQGMLSVNSAIGIAPHALSLMHIFRISDPDGKYSAAVNGRGH